MSDTLAAVVEASSDREMITIRVSRFAAGCLPGVLNHAIEEQVRHMRICADTYDEEARKYAELYLGQLHACVTAVDVARLVKPKRRRDG